MLIIAYRRMEASKLFCLTINKPLERYQEARKRNR